MSTAPTELVLSEDVWSLSTPGFKHDARGARTSNFLTTGSKSGIRPTTSGAGRVLTTPQASMEVRVLPFIGAAENTYPGGFGESYHFKVREERRVAVRPTGSGGARDDVLIWRIDDPAAGGLEGRPAAPHYPVVIENVSAAILNAPQLAANKKLNYPFIWLARISMPANTSQLTSAMIDTSGQVQIGGDTERGTRTRSGDIGPRTLNTRSPGEVFPTVGGMHSFYIPEWATRMIIRGEWNGIWYHHGVNTYGAYWLRIGGSLDTHKPGFDAPATPGGQGTIMTTSWVVQDDLAIPANMRGTVQSVNMMASLGTNAPTGTVTIHSTSQTIVDWEFRESLR